MGHTVRVRELWPLHDQRRRSRLESRVATATMQWTRRRCAGSASGSASGSIGSDSATDTHAAVRTDYTNWCFIHVRWRQFPIFAVFCDIPGIRVPLSRPLLGEKQGTWMHSVMIQETQWYRLVARRCSFMTSMRRRRSTSTPFAYEGWVVFELDGALDPVAELTAIRGYVESSLSHIYR